MKIKNNLLNYIESILETDNTPLIPFTFLIKVFNICLLFTNTETVPSNNPSLLSTDMERTFRCNSLEIIWEILLTIPMSSSPTTLMAAR